MTRDERARRELADRIKRVALEAAADVGDETIENTRGIRSDAEMVDASEAAYQRVVTAVSAVVLASGLRAPAETRAEFIERLKASGAKVETWIGPGLQPVATRKSTFERLAKVERLLAEASDDMGTSTLGFHRVRDARAELRAILGGEGQ